MNRPLRRALIAVILLVSLGMLWTFFRQNPTEPEAFPGGEDFSPYGSPYPDGPHEKPLGRTPEARPAPPVLRGDFHPQRPEQDGRNIAPGDRSPSGQERDDEERPLLRKGAPGGPEELRPEKARANGGDAQGDEESPWEDPLHKEVLGQPTWMAEPTEDEAARIQAVFDEAERRRAEHEDTFVLEDRHRAIELARDAVENCFDGLLEWNPEALGRIVIAFEIHAGDGTAHLENGRVAINVGLQDETFVLCVENALGKIAFGAVGEGVHAVEYPIFLDE